MLDHCTTALCSHHTVLFLSLNKEKMNYTIDHLITMVTEEIAEETGKEDRKSTRLGQMVVASAAYISGQRIFDSYYNNIDLLVYWATTV